MAENDQGRLKNLKQTFRPLEKVVRETKFRAGPFSQFPVTRQRSYDLVRCLLSADERLK